MVIETCTKRPNVRLTHIQGAPKKNGVQLQISIIKR